MGRLKTEKIGSSHAGAVALRALLVFTLHSSVFSLLALADDLPKKPDIPAPRAVREGNRFLEGGDPSAALQRYGEAKRLVPDAREISFDEGLAHFALGEYDKARESFDRAAQGKSDALADDALYSSGTCDHAEAVGPSADPKQSIAKLESAMQRYQSVLSRDANHPAARDAHYKASSLWRELKQQQQQQQEQQSDQQNDSQENQEKQEQSQQQQQSSQEKNEQQQQQEQQQEQQSQQEQQQQQQQAQQQEDQKKESEESQQAQEQTEEDASREQAERKLREIMQAQKDRKKMRPEDTRKPQVQPVAKDW